MDDADAPPRGRPRRAEPAPSEDGTESPRARRRRLGTQLVIVALIGGTLVLILAVLGDFLSGGSDGPSGEGSPEVIASASGVTLTGLAMTDAIDPLTGDPTGRRDRFETGEAAIVWVQFAYDPAATGRDTLHVVWTREGADEELSSGSFRLPQATDHVTATLGDEQTSEPGTYRATVLVNDTELSSIEFEVG